jgi:hypothetical protein
VRIRDAQQWSQSRAPRAARPGAQHSVGRRLGPH